jgi:hypothetical protein
MSLDTQTSNDASNQAPDRHGTNLRQAAEPASAGSSLPTGTKGKRKHAQPHFATHGPDAISRHTPEGNSEKYVRSLPTTLLITAWDLVGRRDSQVSEMVDVLSCRPVSNSRPIGYLLENYHLITSPVLQHTRPFATQFLDHRLEDAPSPSSSCKSQGPISTDKRLEQY